METDRCRRLGKDVVALVCKYTGRVEEPASVRCPLRIQQLSTDSLTPFHLGLWRLGFQARHLTLASPPRSVRSRMKLSQKPDQELGKD